MNLVNHLAERAQQHPHRVALIDSEQSMTYGELYEHVCGASASLRAQGLGRGDTVLILQPVDIPLYISLLGAFHAGLTVMFIDPSAGKAMMRNSLTLHQPDAFIGTGKAHILRLMVPGIRRIKHHFHSTGWVPFSTTWNPAPSGFEEPQETPPDSPALITFTSGSTGIPKAACRTHGFLLAQHKALAESLDYIEVEVDMVTLPIFTLANLASGLTSVLADTDLRFPARADSPAILAQCEKHNVTRCAASPAFFTRLHHDGMMPGFKAIYTGGAPVFPNLLDEIQSANPEMDVVTVFGSTEAEPIAHIAWKNVSNEDHQTMLDGKGLLVGKTVRATQLKIIPDQTGKHIPAMTEDELGTMTLPSGEVGEIIVTGDHVLKGYLHGKGDKENKVQAGDNTWHRTGDAAWIDDSGRVWLVGRCSAAIHKAGKTIYPFGIECSAMCHANLQRCALIEHDGKITLIVEGDADENMRKELLDKLAPMSVECIRFLQTIPVDKRHNAKIDYPLLETRLGKHCQVIDHSL
jgi:acyl-CoA synthetase (AMP-forming)/AMP-acid ligase II